MGYNNLLLKEVIHVAYDDDDVFLPQEIITSYTNSLISIAMTPIESSFSLDETVSPHPIPPTEHDSTITSSPEYIDKELYNLGTSYDGSSFH
ncbi:hypothetical protein Leryth_013584 [Lithospermum erythrorhizon]|nr:hypothetical protein Leryth_013584 [Lithospermum erythrorhizon]